MFFKEYIEIFKSKGIKGLIKEKGWVIAVILFFFFLGKGLLWLLISYLVAKGLF